MTSDDSKKLASELANALSDLSAVRSDLRTSKGELRAGCGPFDSLLERAAVTIEGVRIALRTN